MLSGSALRHPSDTCYPLAEIRVVHLSLDEPLSHVLEGTNPCVIPEKKLKAELKRRNNGLVFSGMNVSIQVECASGVRIIRADILDRDIFDEHPNTPQYTAWSEPYLISSTKLPAIARGTNPSFLFLKLLHRSSSDRRSLERCEAIGDGAFDKIFSDAL